MNHHQIRSFAQRYGTPAYVFDAEKAADRVRLVKEILGPEIKLCYSIKANPFLIPALAEHVDHLEVCSPGELDICRSERVDPGKIIYSGVNKEQADIAAAIDDGAGLLTAESRKHVDLISRAGLQRGKKVPVILRLNAGSQFGMSREDLLDVIAGREELPGMEIQGIHYFAGTQRRKPAQQEKELAELLELFRLIREQYGLTLKKLEYGPGLPVPYFQNEDFSDTLEPLKKIVECLRCVAGEVELTVEMGRFLSAECGSYITRVVDCKENKGIHYAIVDGGMHHLNYFGQIMGMKIPVIDHVGSGESGGEEKWTVCGSLCTTSDVICKEVPLRALREGDLLVFHNAGAYSVTEGISLFLSRSLPRVILQKTGGELLLRDAFETSLLNRRNGV